MATEPAGIDWTSQVSAADSSWKSVAWGNGTFVAVADFGAGSRVMTSPDGITWTSRSAAVANGWMSVAWGNGTFVAVSRTGTGNRVMTSPDGITWTSQTSAANNYWTSVVWGGPAGLEQFVAVAATGSGNRVMTSPDGITWTSRTPAANNEWNSVAWGNGTFVAVSANGSGNRVMTSPDGITWTSRSASAENRWTSVTWGNGTFVAVSSASSNNVMTSLDGVNWTSRSASNNAWTAVAWVGPAGQQQFVAVSDSGSGNRVMTSPDGLTWTAQTSAADNEWTSLAWGNGTLVAVSATGTGNRVMTSTPEVTCSTLLPRVPPGPPRDVVASATLGGANVTWSPPEDPGTDDVNLYAVRAWPGGPVCQVPASALSCTVAGLDPQQSYYFTVVAMSGAGWGAASAPSNTIRPVAPEPPGAPTNMVAMAGNAQATVSWNPPSNGGSSPIREYRVTSSPAGGACVAAAPACTVTGLVNGTAYSFTVEARNDQGWGPASQASAAVTPRAPAISIQGNRSGRIVSIDGMTVGMSAGTPVEVWVRLGDSGSFARGASMVTVGPAGAINWNRRLNPDKQVAVYVMADGVQSNTVLVPGRRAR